MRTKALTVSELAQVNHVAARRAERLADYFAKVAAVAADADKERRATYRSCLVCFYLDSRIAGQMFTDWKCRLCDTTGSWPNTAVPHVCKACSDAFGLCTLCGGTLDCRQKSPFARKAKRARQQLAKRAGKVEG